MYYADDTAVAVQEKTFEEVETNLNNTFSHLDEY